jgi:histone-lysine N-methyltransferase SETMAR
MPSGDACVRLNVDATRVGNVARFINHACDGGNLLPCLVRAAGSVIPRLVLFARRDIPNGEELRYSYGSCGGVAGKVLPCYCRTPACFGTLPSDIT